MLLEAAVLSVVVELAVVVADSGPAEAEAVLAGRTGLAPVKAMAPPSPVIADATDVALSVAAWAWA